MNDHETIMTKALEEERNRIEDEVWRKAPLFDKAFGFVVLFTVVFVIVSPFCIIFQLIKLYWK